MNTNDTRNARIAWAVCALLAVTFACILGRECKADVFQCEAINGCVARINESDGTQREVIFREGDVVNTGAGWIVSTDDGWYRLRPGDHSRRRFRWVSPPPLPLWHPPSRWNGQVPPDISWIGVPPWTSYAAGWTALRCDREVCWVVSWDLGLVPIPGGMILDPATARVTPILLLGTWTFWSGWL